MLKSLHWMGPCRARSADYVTGWGDANQIGVLWRDCVAVRRGGQKNQRLTQLIQLKRFPVLFSQCFRRSVERVKGIEPSYAAWEAAVLPLNYTRDSIG